MPEPDFYNNTPFKAEILPFWDVQGRESRLVVIKASYELGGPAPHKLLEQQRPVRLGDEPWGDPEVPDYKYPSDLCAFKPGTDFLVAGHAVGLRGRAAPHFDVIASCAGRTRRARAHGPRRWTMNAVGQMSVGPSEPVERIPMCWRLAFGGRDFSEPDTPRECKENPAGLGIARDPLLLLHQPAPQIEDPDHPVRSPNQGAKPIGFGPLGPSFEPRRSLAGTYDPAWLEHVYPAKPKDYVPAFENVAPREFVFETPLRGREVGGVQGMTAEETLSFQVPVERPFVQWVIDGKEDRHEPHLDTVLLDTDAKVLELTWRACIPCPAKMRKRFTQVDVSRKEILTR